MNTAKPTTKSLVSIFFLASLIGILAGIASWLFRLLIGLIHNLAFSGHFNAHYDANIHTSGSYLGWLIIFAPVLGGIIVVYLIKNFAPEAKGHGVPEVMHAIYHKRGNIPAQVSIVKALASAITIGTGGSLGREGPIVQISAAFSSFLGKLTRLPVSQRNLLIACGASGGIAATFNAPLGGILFSIELLLVSINSRTILPVAISTVIAANVGHYLIGTAPAFIIPNYIIGTDNNQIIATLFAIPLGAMIGLLSLLFIKSIYFAEDLFDDLPINDYLKHILGTAILGIIFYSIYTHTGHYYVQGVGYATIEDVLKDLISDPAFLLLLIAAKLLATSLTIGSGGSGGVFSPSLFLGAVAGALFGSIVSILFPSIDINPIIFVLSGMAAMVSATTSAPLTAAIIVYEMTLDYNAVLVILTAVAIAYAVRRHLLTGDIYTLKLNRRGESVPEELVADLKSNIIVNDALTTKLLFLSKDEDISPSDNNFACIVNEEGSVSDIINLKYYYVSEHLSLDIVKKEPFITLKSGITVAQAITILHRNNCDIALVSKSGGVTAESVIGIVTSRYLIDLIANVSETLRL